MARGFVGDPTDIPFIIVALAGYDIVFSDFASERHGTFVGGGYTTDKCKEVRETFLVHEWAVGGHGHS